MNKIIIDAIYKRIIELSDLRMQRKLWLNENNNTGLVSSYNELICSLFDDLNFDIFVDDTAIKIGLSRSTVLELNTLRNLLENYVEKESSEKIIVDPEWIKIVEQAKIIIEKWVKI